MESANRAWVVLGALYTLISTASTAQSATSISCLYNSTHCSCSEILKYPGNCLRPQSRHSCVVDQCSDKGFVCDCDGAQICRFERCKGWVSSSAMSNALLPRGRTVECKENEWTQCLRQTGANEGLMVGQQEIEYRMVQFGARSESTMVNMTAFQFSMYLVVVGEKVRGEFTELESAKGELRKYPSGAKGPIRLVAEVIDGVVQRDPHTVGGEEQSLGGGFNKYWRNWEDINRLMQVCKNYIGQAEFKFNLHGKWTHARSLHARYIHMRLYEERGRRKKILCGIYNTYGIGDDGLGKMKVKVSITGMDGQMLEWVVCDDEGECGGEKGKKLNGSHVLISRLSDGWCVKPVEWNGNGIKVEFSEVEGMRGVVLQSTGGSERVFEFGDGSVGMRGEVDANGLVRKGSSPQIVFNLRGIQVPPQVWKQ